MLLFGENAGVIFPFFLKYNHIVNLYSLMIFIEAYWSVMNLNPSAGQLEQ